MLIVTAVNQVELDSMHDELVRAVHEKAGGSDLQTTEIAAYILHLHDFQSVEAFASEMRRMGTELNVVLLNAGMLTTGWVMTEDGIEKSLQVNYVSNILLFLLLLPHPEKDESKSSAPRSYAQDYVRRQRWAHGCRFTVRISSG